MVATLVGTILGFLSGLGTGGGSLLVLWLTLALDYPSNQARVMNLMFFIPSAVIACLFRWKQGSLPVKKVLPGILAGCVAAFAFSQVSQKLEGQWMENLFGGLLIFTGLRELFYRERKFK